MRRYLLPALMISLLLTGCGSAAGMQQKLEEQWKTLAAAEELSFTADVTANLGSEVFQCTLRCTATQAETAVEVLDPECVAGIRAVVREGEAALEYGDISLGLGTGELDAATPIAAPALLVRALRSGFLQRFWTEKDGERELLVTQLYLSDDTDLTLWYDAGTLTPVHGEFTREGAVLLNCDITEFTYR